MSTKVDTWSRCSGQMASTGGYLTRGPTWPAPDHIQDRPDRARQSRRTSHVLFYVESAEGVDVIRILHQRMDPTRHL